MKVALIAVAEYATLSVDNKLTVAGIFNNINYERQPGVSPGEVKSVPLPIGYFVCTTEFSLSEGLQHAAELRVVNGNGEFTPAHDINSTAVFIPTAFDTMMTFTAPGQPTETNHDTSAKAAPITNTITCTIPFQSFPSPFGTFTIEGTVTGFMTPR